MSHFMFLPKQETPTTYFSKNMEQNNSDINSSPALSPNPCLTFQAKNDSFGHLQIAFQLPLYIFAINLGSCLQQHLQRSRKPGK